MPSGDLKTILKSAAEGTVQSISIHRASPSSEEIVLQSLNWVRLGADLKTEAQVSLLSIGLNGPLVVERGEAHDSKFVRFEVGTLAGSVGCKAYSVNTSVPMTSGFSGALPPATIVVKGGKKGQTVEVPRIAPEVNVVPHTLVLAAVDDSSTLLSGKLNLERLRDGRVSVEVSCNSQGLSCEASSIEVDSDHSSQLAFWLDLTAVNDFDDLGHVELSFFDSEDENELSDALRVSVLIDEESVSSIDRIDQRIRLLGRCEAGELKQVKIPFVGRVERIQAAKVGLMRATETVVSSLDFDVVSGASLPGGVVSGVIEVAVPVWHFASIGTNELTLEIYVNLGKRLSVPIQAWPAVFTCREAALGTLTIEVPDSAYRSVVRGTLHFSLTNRIESGHLDVEIDADGTDELSARVTRDHLVLRKTQLERIFEVDYCLEVAGRVNGPRKARLVARWCDGTLQEAFEFEIVPGGEIIKLEDAYLAGAAGADESAEVASVELKLVRQLEDVVSLRVNDVRHPDYMARTSHESQAWEKSELSVSAPLVRERRGLVERLTSRRAASSLLVFDYTTVRLLGRWAQLTTDASLEIDLT